MEKTSSGSSPRRAMPSRPSTAPEAGPSTPSTSRALPSLSLDLPSRPSMSRSSSCSNRPLPCPPPTASARTSTSTSPSPRSRSPSSSSLRRLPCPPASASVYTTSHPRPLPRRWDSLPRVDTSPLRLTIPKLPPINTAPLPSPGLLAPPSKSLLSAESPICSPLTPIPPSPATTQKRRMAKLRRQLGASLPQEAVFGTKEERVTVLTRVLRKFETMEKFERVIAGGKSDSSEVVQITFEDLTEEDEDDMENDTLLIGNVGAAIEEEEDAEDQEKGPAVPPKDTLAFQSPPGDLLADYAGSWIRTPAPPTNTPFTSPRTSSEDTRPSPLLPLPSLASSSTSATSSERSASPTSFHCRSSPLSPSHSHSRHPSTVSDDDSDWEDDEETARLDMVLGVGDLAAQKDLMGGLGDQTAFEATFLNRLSRSWVRERGGRRWVEHDFEGVLAALREL